MMKRFWKEARVAPVDDGFAIHLDGRPLRTPAQAALIVDSRPLAEAIAAEWDAQEQDIDPRAMPATGFANAAIDRVAPDPAAFATELGRYAEADLLCYRADAPAELAARQTEKWDPVLNWAGARFGARFHLGTGILHIPQPEETIAHLRAAILRLDPFRLAALSPLVTISGSLVIALALVDGALDPEIAFDLAHLDELWQVEQWGEDELALKAREARKADFLAAARFLDLLD